MDYNAVTVGVYVAISYERLKQMGFYDPVKWLEVLCTHRSLLGVRLDWYAGDVVECKKGRL